MPQQLIMRSIIVYFWLMALVCGLELRIDPKINLRNTQNTYQLKCTSAQGAVSYRVQNLPKNIVLQGDRILLVGLVPEGYYPIKVRATDEGGNSDEQIIVIVIIHTKEQQNPQPTSNQIRMEPQQPKLDLRINEVLDSYAVPMGADGNYVYPDNGYPTVNLPTGGKSNSFNPTPNQILTSQASASADNRNIITQEDIRTQAIFQRQLNAAKALANLLDIIKRATANKNAAEAQILKRQSLLSNAKQKQRASQEQILNIQNNLSRLKNGIKSLTLNITQIRDNIVELEKQIVEKKAERSVVENMRTEIQVTLNGVNGRMEMEESRLKETKSREEMKKEEYEIMQRQYANFNGELNIKNEEKEKIGQQLVVSRAEAAQQARIVEQLMRQLALAREKLMNDSLKVAKLMDSQRNINANIQNIQIKVQQTKNKIATAFLELQSLKNQINELSLKTIPSLQSQKSSLTSQLANLSKQITLFTQEIQKNIPKTISFLQSKLPKLNRDLSYLRTQLPVFSRVLNDAYEAGNSANQAVIAAGNNLKAAKKRFEEEMKIIENATRNIEIARTEKEEADLAVDNLLKEGAELLAFSPIETNPLLVKSDGSLFIASWNDYIKEVYGEKVQPYYTGTATTLYSFSPISTTSPSSFCSLNDSEISLSGFIIISNPSTSTSTTTTTKKIFRLLTTNKVYTVSLTGCTKGMSTLKEYEMQGGDIAVVKGTLSEDGVSLEASMLSCARQ